MKNFFRSWKTTLAGAAIILLKLLAAHGKVNPADMPLIVAGIGLIAAKDGNVSGADKNENK